jgi:hypothetical protein
MERSILSAKGFLSISLTITLRKWVNIYFVASLLSGISSPFLSSLILNRPPIVSRKNMPYPMEIVD